MDKLSNLVLDDAEQHITLEECMENEGVSFCGLGFITATIVFFILLLGFSFSSFRQRDCCFHDGVNTGQGRSVQMSSSSIPRNSLRFANSSFTESR